MMHNAHTILNFKAGERVVQTAQSGEVMIIITTQRVVELTPGQETDDYGYASNVTVEEFTEGLTDFMRDRFNE